MTRSELAQKLAERTNECGLIYAIHELIGNGVNVEIGFYCHCFFTPVARYIIFSAVKMENAERVLEMKRKSLL